LHPNEQILLSLRAACRTGVAKELPGQSGLVLFLVNSECGFWSVCIRLLDVSSQKHPKVTILTKEIATLPISPQI